MSGLTTAVYLLTDRQCRRLLTAYGFPADPAYHCDGLRGIVGMLVRNDDIDARDITSILTNGRIITMTYGYTYEIESPEGDGDVLDVTGEYTRGTPNRPTREDPGYGEPPEIWITEILSRKTGREVTLTNKLELYLMPIIEEQIHNEDWEA